MSEVDKGFNVKGRWYFRHGSDGSVHISAPDSLGPGASQVITLTAEEWAAVAASMASPPESAEQ